MAGRIKDNTSEMALFIGAGIAYLDYLFGSLRKR
jgi:hypothetical protein